MLVVVVERLVDEVKLYRDTGVELIGITMVAHKEYIADEGIETITQHDVLFAGLAGKNRFHLALGVILCAHTIHAVSFRLYIGCPHFIGIFMEDTAEYMVIDVRLGIEFLLEVQTVGLDLLSGHTE